MSRLLRAKLTSGKPLNNQIKKRVRYAEEEEVYNDAQKRPRTHISVSQESSEDEEYHEREVATVTTATPANTALARSRACASTSTPGNILNLIRSRVVDSPGTPAIPVPEIDSDDDDDEDHLISQDIDEVKEGNVKKAHAGGITTVYLFDVNIFKSNGFYRAAISDGEVLSNKVLFNSKLNKKVEDELVGEGRVSVVKLEIIDVLQDCIIGVQAFKKLGEGPAHVGEAQFLGDEYYRSLKPRGCFTPSRMKKKTLFK